MQLYWSSNLRSRQSLLAALFAVLPAGCHGALAPFDRVCLLLDVDRDYSTYYHLQIDQRGCTREDCWGDVTWNPKWYVAVHSEPGV